MVGKNGFLPESDPALKLTQEFSYLDDVGAGLVSLVKDDHFRFLAKSLPVIDFSEHSLSNKHLERLMLLYSYFASAYVWGNGNQDENKVIPNSISVPLTTLARRLHRPPILAYASYCLNNWKRIDSNKSISLGNIALSQNFVDCYDEDWFILVHVDIEYKGSKAVNAIWQLKNKIFDGNKSYDGNSCIYADCAIQFRYLLNSLEAMNETMNRMPERCDPDVYYNRVRPYIFGFQDVVYEDCFDNKPQTYRGETGAQSSLVPTIQLGLGIKHKSSMLTKHLDDMRNYMPIDHRKKLAILEASVPPYNDDYSNASDKDLRKFVVNSKDKHLTNLYNSCVEELYKFRKTHFDYAVDYINKKVDNPSGTGGTPYMLWLKNLLDETLEYIIK